jgi:hypothetical protein
MKDEEFNGLLADHRHSELKSLLKKIAEKKDDDTDAAILNAVGQVQGAMIIGGFNDANSVFIQTQDTATQALIDNALFETPIEIRVYP